MSKSFLSIITFGLLFFGVFYLQVTIDYNPHLFPKFIRSDLFKYLSTSLIIIVPIVTFLLKRESSEKSKKLFNYFSYGIITLSLLFISITQLPKLALLNSNSNSSSNTYYCNWCGDDYRGRGFTTAMYVVNQVDDESNPLNSYCSRKCAIDWIRSKGREPLRVN